MKVSVRSHNGQQVGQAEARAACLMTARRRVPFGKGEISICGRNLTPEAPSKSVQFLKGTEKVQDKGSDNRVVRRKLSDYVFFFTGIWRTCFSRTVEH